MKNVFLSLFKQRQTYLYTAVTLFSFYIFFITMIQIKGIYSILVLDLAFLEKVKVFLSFYFSPFDTFSTESFILFILSTTLLGMQFSLMRLYAQRMTLNKNTSLSFAGVVSTLLGCLACCGSFVFAALTTLFGVSVQSLFPFQGREFGYIGLCIALLSFFFMVRTYTKPQVC